MAEPATEESRASIVVGGTLDVAAVAGQLRVAKQTVYKLIRGGHLGCVREGRRIRIRPQDVEAYLDAARLKPGQLAHLDPNRDRRRAVEGNARLTRAGVPDRLYGSRYKSGEEGADPPVDSRAEADGSVAWSVRSGCRRDGNG